MNRILAYEMTLLDNIAGKGLKLFKKDSNGNFNPIKSEFGSIVADPCN